MFPASVILSSERFSLRSHADIIPRFARPINILRHLGRHVFTTHLLKMVGTK